MKTLSSLFADPAFALAFRVREPAPAASDALLVLLHGVGSNESNLADLSSGVASDTLVVLPRGRLELAPGQYAWFRVAFTASGPRIVADEAEASRLALIRLIEQLQTAHGVAPERTVIAGFSQGGILSASVALSAPERVRGFAILSGRILPELEPALASPGRLARLHGLVAHGRDDSKLPVTWAERADAWLDRLGVPHVLRLYPGDHGISSPMARDFLAWQQALLASASPPARLSLSAEQASLAGLASSDEPLRLAPGVERLVREHFGPRVSPPAAMENAIAAIEDELARVPASVHGIAIESSDPYLHAIADAAGVTATVITREAVEHVFARLSAVALGRPAASEGLPDDPRFDAALLVVRELMHHLDIPSIHLRGHGRPAVNR